ncbi:MAG: hypothetical protein Q7J65_05470 [Candidatus Marinimicrobia bacterium]|nr:hypothetical protein [Candidatus Neomarinimicrobiota bacterium]
MSLIKKINISVILLSYGFSLTILTVFLLSSCNIWSDITNISCSFYNASSYDVIVEYSTIESEGLDSISVSSNKGKQLFFYGYDGRLDEPSKDDFSSYIHYIKVFVDDTLVYSQEPTDILLWSKPYINEDDGIINFHYGFHFTDSLITHYESP